MKKTNFEETKILKKKLKKSPKSGNNFIVSLRWISMRTGHLPDWSSPDDPARVLAAIFSIWVSHSGTLSSFSEVFNIWSSSHVYWLVAGTQIGYKPNLKKCSQYSSAVCKLEANYRQVFVSASCSKTPASLCSLSAQTLAKMYLSKLINLFPQKENVFFPNCTCCPVSLIWSGHNKKRQSHHFKEKARSRP